jgi:hypothetical protein
MGWIITLLGFSGNSMKYCEASSRGCHNHTRKAFEAAVHELIECFEGVQKQGYPATPKTGAACREDDRQTARTSAGTGTA